MNDRITGAMVIFFGGAAILWALMALPIYIGVPALAAGLWILFFREG